MSERRAHDLAHTISDHLFLRCQLLQRTLLHSESALNCKTQTRQLLHREVEEKYYSFYQSDKKLNSSLRARSDKELLDKLSKIIKASNDTVIRILVELPKPVRDEVEPKIREEMPALSIEQVHRPKNGPKAVLRVQAVLTEGPNLYRSWATQEQLNSPSAVTIEECLARYCDLELDGFVGVTYVQRLASHQQHLTELVYELRLITDEFSLWPGPLVNPNLDSSTVLGQNLRR